MDENNFNVASFTEDGFIVLKNILTESEISSLRLILKNHFRTHGIKMLGGITQPNAAVLLPELDWIFSHSKIIDAFKNLFPDKKLMFTSHCDIHNGIITNWHKDDGVVFGKDEFGYFGCTTYGVEDCRVYKIAIYLQDHINNLSGLKIRRKSHKIASNEIGEEVYLKTQLGDVIIFDVRLTHSGQTEIIPITWLKKPINLIRKLFRYSSRLDQVIKSIYELIFGTKLSIFFTFGYPNDWTVVFSKNNMKRQIQQNKFSRISLPITTKNKLVKQGVLLAEEHFDELLTYSSDFSL
jgi:hypothetical protein